MRSMFILLWRYFRHFYGRILSVSVAKRWSSDSNLNYAETYDTLFKFNSGTLAWSLSERNFNGEPILTIIRIISVPLITTLFYIILVAALVVTKLESLFPQSPPAFVVVLSRTRWRHQIDSPFDLCFGNRWMDILRFSYILFKRFSRF